MSLRFLRTTLQPIALGHTIPVVFGISLLVPALGLGKGVPFFPGTNSDSILAFLPKEERWVVIRVPYPMGFHARDVDGRIDDPKAGLKGKTLWAPHASAAMGHQENGGLSHVTSFQMRPDPLAH
jgi:hypothetical protein